MRDGYRSCSCRCVVRFDGATFAHKAQLDKPTASTKHRIVACSLSACDVHHHPSPSVSLFSCIERYQYLFDDACRGKNALDGIKRASTGCLCSVFRRDGPGQGATRPSSEDCPGHPQGQPPRSILTHDPTQLMLSRQNAKKSPGPEIPVQPSGTAFCSSDAECEAQMRSRKDWSQDYVRTR